MSARNTAGRSRMGLSFGDQAHDEQVTHWSGACRVCPLGVISKDRTVRHECPLYPRKRTFSEAAQMSAKCQKRTSEYSGRQPFNLS